MCSYHSLIRAQVAMLLLLASFASFSQQEGKISVYASPEIRQLLDDHLTYNMEDGVVNGYRIQLLSSAVLKKVRDAKTEFLENYEDLPATIVHEAPNYKLRIGNYLDRFDAYRDLQLLVREYKSAFIVKDIIQVSDFYE